MKKYLLEVIVFICGAVVMILELVGSRILAPYVGTSIVVWTSLIGVVLGSLSIGYWWGGRLADRGPSAKTLSLLIFWAGVSIACAALTKGFVLETIQDRIRDVHLGAIVGTMVLFALPSVLLGMVSPYAVKLKMRDLGHSGSTVGALYAISTVGSIGGTFLAGFLLIAYFGSTNILLVLAGVLAAASLLASFKSSGAGKIGLFIGSVIGLVVADSHAAFMARQGLIDTDTRYQRVLVSEGRHERSGRPVRLMMTNPQETQSAMYLDSDDDLVIEYTKFFRLAAHFKPGLRRSLMIGGAGYSYPKDFLRRHHGATMDVVEIDPGVTELARRYFNLRDDPGLAIHHEDARTFLHRAEARAYDVIFGDAYRSFYAIPYHLTTREATQKMYDCLTEDGVVLVNMISAIEGKKGKFLRAAYATFTSVFPQVYLFPVETNDNGAQVQNIVLVALKSAGWAGMRSEDPELDGYLKHLWRGPVARDMPLLTDEHAPVDNYIMEVIRDRP